ncbi:CxxC-x17-CxxC domain-containing protein [Methanosarcina sp. T3]|uniref:CxxC-x17-CxxC domain-containing protein n=1 Tax=Methanosarcina sp. T3 TaxID=3439062 RepID=UPI003F8724F7
MGFNDRGNSYRGRDSNRGGSRDGNRGGFRGGNSGPREMHKVVCSDCGVETEVPFKPTEGRPVYCRDCLPNHRKF